jgi:hypothetical protein
VSASPTQVLSRSVAMADVVFVLVTLAGFALVALVARGVARI